MVKVFMEPSHGGIRMIAQPLTYGKKKLLSWERYTSKPGVTYAIALEWPTTGLLNLTCPIPVANTTVTLLGLPDVKLS